MKTFIQDEYENQVADFADWPSLFEAINDQGYIIIEIYVSKDIWEGLIEDDITAEIRVGVRDTIIYKGNTTKLGRQLEKNSILVRVYQAGTEIKKSNINGLTCPKCTKVNHIKLFNTIIPDFLTCPDCNCSVYIKEFKGG